MTRQADKDKGKDVGEGCDKRDGVVHWKKLYFVGKNESGNIKLKLLALGEPSNHVTSQPAKQITIWSANQLQNLPGNQHIS